MHPSHSGGDGVTVNNDGVFLPAKVVVLDLLFGFDDVGFGLGRKAVRTFALRAV